MLFILTIVFTISPISGSIVGFISCYSILSNSYNDIYNLLIIMPLKTKKLIGSLYCPLIFVNLGGYLLGGLISLIITTYLPVQLFLTGAIVIILQNLIIPSSFKHGFASSPSLGFGVLLILFGLISAFMNFIIYSNEVTLLLRQYSLPIFLVGTALLILSTLHSYKKSLSHIYG